MGLRGIDLMNNLLKWMLIGLLCTAPQVWAGAVSNVRIWPAPDHTRLVFDLTGPVDHKLFALSGPERLVIDLSGTVLQTSMGAIDLQNSPIRKIRSAKRNESDLRVVLDLKQSVKPKSFVLQPNDQYGHRLVVDLYGAGSAAAEVTKRVDEHSQRRDILIVIDPGHGGDDPGAIGPRGVREKDVVLAISRELQAMLNHEKGFNGRLTRKGDYFIALRNRTDLARQYNADLMVSIHADAFKSPAANGSSVYALSKRGATSETARWLATKENMSDLIGGVGSVSLDDKDDVLAGVLLDLSMTASLKSSLNVGHYVLKSMGRVSKLHKKRVEQAGFVVLKSPDIPSILVETGFISNPVESGRLRTQKYQRKVAQAIYHGLQGYFEDSPPPGTLMAWQKFQKRQAQGLTYKIERGDTLSEIAQRNRVTLNDLMKINNLQDPGVRIGQVLRIPAS